MPAHGQNLRLAHQILKAQKWSARSPFFNNICLFSTVRKKKGAICVRAGVYYRNWGAQSGQIAGSGLATASSVFHTVAR